MRSRILHDTRPLGKMKMFARLRDNRFASLPRVYEADRKSSIDNSVDRRENSEREEEEGRCRNVRYFPDKSETRGKQLYIYIYIFYFILIKLKIRESCVENLHATCVAPDTLILVHGSNAGRDSPGFGKRLETPGAPPCSPKVVDRSL